MKIYKDKKNQTIEEYYIKIGLIKLVIYTKILKEKKMN